jgi:hypothetical protein
MDGGATEKSEASELSYFAIHLLSRATPSLLQERNHRWRIPSRPFTKFNLFDRKGEL